MQGVERADLDQPLGSLRPSFDTEKCSEDWQAPHQKEPERNSRTESATAFDAKCGHSQPSGVRKEHDVDHRQRAAQEFTTRNPTANQRDSKYWKCRHHSIDGMDSGGAKLA